jgi:hypothetical protein
MTKNIVSLTDFAKFRGLRFTVEPRNDFWRLRQPDSIDVYTGLVGWVTNGKQRDARVPPQVIELLTYVMCNCALLTFFYPSEASEGSAESWQAIDQGYHCKLRGTRPSWLTRRPDYPLFSTADRESAEKLFYAEPFNWELQQQMVLLSAPDSAPPTLDYESIHKAYTSGNYEHLMENGIDGILYPALDGDFAGLMVFRKKLWEGLLLKFAESCAAREYEWGLMSESDFQKIFKKSLDVFIFTARRNGGRKSIEIY